MQRWPFVRELLALLRGCRESWLTFEQVACYLVASMTWGATSLFVPGLLIALLAAPAEAQSTSGEDVARPWKRAAAVELSLAAAFGGVSAALLVTQDDNFAAGVGLGHAFWGAAFLVGGLHSLVWSARIARSAKVPRPPSLRVRRWDLALASFLPAVGIAVVALSRAADIEDRAFGAGVGTVYLVYGTGGLAWSAWQLALAKRRRDTARVRVSLSTIGLRF